MDTGHTDEAIAVAEQSAVDRERALGADHPQTLAAKLQLSVAYGSADRHSDAARVLAFMLGASERVHGPEHSETVLVLMALANSLCALGRYEDALALEERVLTTHERQLGPDHPDTIDARSSLAITHTLLGRHEEALRLREQVLSDRTRTLGPNHPDTLEAADLAAASRSALGPRTAHTRWNPLSKVAPTGWSPLSGLYSVSASGGPLSRRCPVIVTTTRRPSAASGTGRGHRGGPRRRLFSSVGAGVGTPGNRRSGASQRP